MKVIIRTIIYLAKDYTSPYERVELPRSRAEYKNLAHFLELLFQNISGS